MSFAKAGRNEPCPCGSGKKFKKCCGSPLRQKAQMPVQPTLSAQIPAGGVPGEAQGIVACNHFRDEADPRNIGSVPGLPGEYGVTFLFERPNYRQTKEYETVVSWPVARRFPPSDNEACVYTARPQRRPNQGLCHNAARSI